jgi:hypothetical protein
MSGKRTITLEDGKTITIGSKRTRDFSDKQNESTRYIENLHNDGFSNDKTMLLGDEPITGGPLAWLIEKKGERIGRTHRLADGITSIGRDANNHIVLNDQSISAQHAKIRVEEGKYVLYDLVSENGTEVNNEKIVYKEINENDEVKIGDTILVFKKID